METAKPSKWSSVAFPLASQISTIMSVRFKYCLTFYRRVTIAGKPSNHGIAWSPILRRPEPCRACLEIRPETSVDGSAGYTPGHPS